MITKGEFKGLFDFLKCNNWKFIPSQDKFELQEQVFYEKLKNYDYTHLKTAFNNIFDSADQEQFPSLQRIKGELDNILRIGNQKKGSPYHKMTNKLLRRMIEQAKYIIAKYGNDRQKLADCGMYYTNLSREAKREKGITQVYYNGVTYYASKIPKFHTRTCQTTLNVPNQTKTV